MSFFNKIGNFFSSVWNVVCNSWIGAIAGIVVGLILIVILSLTAFKQHGMPKIVTAILILLFAFLGGFIQFQFFYNDIKKDAELIKVIPGTNIADPVEYTDNKANEGLTKTEIDIAEADPDCPIAEDKQFNISMVEYADIVIFYYEEEINEQKILHDIAFEKTENGLVFTGALNVGLEKKWNWVLPKFWKSGFKYYFKDFNLKENWFNPLKSEIQDNTTNYYFMCYEPKVHALLNENKAFELLYRKIKASCMKLMQKGCYELYNNYFQQLGDFGIKATDDTVMHDMANFYNSVFNSTKTLGLSAKVDVTSLVGDVKDGIVYKSNRFLEVEYFDYSKTNALFGSANTPVDDYVDIVAPDTNIVVSATLSSEYAGVTFKFEPYNNADLSAFDIKENPITVKYTNVEDSNIVYEFFFDELEEFETACQVYMRKGAYTEHIESQGLIISNPASPIVVDEDGFTRVFYVHLGAKN